MSDDLRHLIAFTLGQKTTDALLAIWIANDRAEWSNDAFEAIRSILDSRHVELPAQLERSVAQPHPEESGSWEDAPGAAITPVFYHPVQVQLLARRLDQLAPYAIAATIAANLTSLLSLHRTITTYFLWSSQAELIALVIAVFAGALILALPCGLIYYTLRSAAAILVALMKIEFNSRTDAGAISLESPGECPE